MIGLLHQQYTLTDIYVASQDRCPDLYGLLSWHNNQPKSEMHTEQIKNIIATVLKPAAAAYEPAGPDRYDKLKKRAAPVAGGALPFGMHFRLFCLRHTAASFPMHVDSTYKMLCIYRSTLCLQQRPCMQRRDAH